MFSLTWTAVVVLISVLFLSAPFHTCAFDPDSPYPYLTSGTFASIKNTPAERLVLFFHSSPTATTTLSTLNTVARRLRTDLPHFLVQYCNGSDPANTADFQSAGFTSGEWLFTSTPVEGIMKYTGPVTVAELVDQVRHKYLPSSASDLVRFSSEDEFYALLDTPPALPVLVKFFEPWCEHCKRLAPTFAISATYFRSSIRHVEVQCSGSTEETDFCKRHGVHSYPVVMLFDGERSVRYEGEERSVRAFDGWFEENVSGYTSRVKAARKEKRKGNKAVDTELDFEEAAPSPSVEKREGETKRGLKEERGAKAAVSSKADRKTKPDVEKRVESVKAVTQTERTVAERLSSLENEVSEMHSTLRAIQQQLTKLAGQGR